MNQRHKQRGGNPFAVLKQRPLTPDFGAVPAVKEIAQVAAESVAELSEATTEPKNIKAALRRVKAALKDAKIAKAEVERRYIELKKEHVALHGLFEEVRHRFLNAKNIIAELGPLASPLRPIPLAQTNDSVGHARRRAAKARRPINAA